MIYNRTKADVDAALLLRENKVQKFIMLTEAEIETLENGTMTINTLNRIEDKQAELKGLLNWIGYWNINIVTKVWDYSQIFTKEEFQRIVDNVDVLREAFFVYANTPITPSAIYYFENLNDLEKILNDLEVMLNDVKSNYRECGNFECGVIS